MDWKNPESDPVHVRKDDVDLRHRIICSIEATAAFFAMLSMSAIMIVPRSIIASPTLQLESWRWRLYDLLYDLWANPQTLAHRPARHPYEASHWVMK